MDAPSSARSGPSPTRAGSPDVDAQAESRAHLRKAREFLAASRLEAERQMFTAAASSAVLAGIKRQGRDLPATDRPHQQIRRPPFSSARARSRRTSWQGLGVHLPPPARLEDGRPVPVRTDQPHRRHQGSRLGNAHGQHRRRPDDGLRPYPAPSTTRARASSPRTHERPVRNPCTARDRIADPSVHHADAVGSLAR